MVNQFHKRGYNRSLIEQQIDKANLQEREQLLKEKKKQNAINTPLSLKYNKTPPKINCYETLATSAYKPKYSSNMSKCNCFSLPPKQKPQRLFGKKLIEKGKLKRKFTNKIQSKCTPCLANNRTLRCKQVEHTTTFRINKTKRMFQEPN